MINASTALKTLIASGTYGRADLYTVSPVGLPVLYLTSADQDVTWNGVTYQHGLLRVTRDQLRTVAGLETDTFSLTLAVDPLNEMTINGVPFRQAAQWGLLDGAQIELDWAYLDGWGPPPDVVGVLTRFVGLAADIAIDRTGVKISCKSWLSLLDTQVPSQVYQAHCRFLLGDSHCGVDVSSYGKSGSVTAMGSTTQLATTLTDANGTWNLGYVSFSSGINKGVSRAVRTQSGGSLTLAGPLPWSPAAGDEFTIYPGCDKTMPTFQQGSDSATVPKIAPYQITLTGFVQDYGVSQQITVTSTDDWGNQSSSTSWQSMTLVAGAPAKGQYAVSAAGVYSFAAADAGSSVEIAYRTVGPGCTASCWTKFQNPERFGGMPYIPAPETAT
jgi:uncharacterized phage protein (TIGR02218 family)